MGEPGAPFGDASFHLCRERLENGLAALHPPRDRGELALIVARGEGGLRATPPRARLTPEEGVPGDAWARSRPLRHEAQVTLMRVDVVRLLANGQPLTLFGDNLLVDLDLSADNLPAGSRLRIGQAVLEVTPEPHQGCLKFRQRFGADALRLTAAPGHRPQRLRGIHARVVEAGEVAPGDGIEVSSRP